MSTLTTQWRAFRKQSQAQLLALHVNTDNFVKKLIGNIPEVSADEKKKLARLIDDYRDAYSQENDQITSDMALGKLNDVEAEIKRQKATSKLTEAYKQVVSALPGYGIEQRCQLNAKLTAYERNVNFAEDVYRLGLMQILSKAHNGAKVRLKTIMNVEHGFIETEWGEEDVVLGLSLYSK